MQPGTQTRTCTGLCTRAPLCSVAHRASPALLSYLKADEPRHIGRREGLGCYPPPQWGVLFRDPALDSFFVKLEEETGHPGF